MVYKHIQAKLLKQVTNFLELELRFEEVEEKLKALVIEKQKMEEEMHGMRGKK